MNPVRCTILLGFVLTTLAWAPLRAHAGAQPYVVVSADLAVQSVEVAISSKQLTLIHFETGDVSMVAVGDPTVVNITVKGPDVLVRALVPSGSTNAFVWQAARYTQWIFTVRQTSQDARLIIVRDSVTARRDESGSTQVGWRKPDGKNATGPVPVGTASEASVGDAAAGTTIGPAPQPFAEPPRQATTVTAAGANATSESLSLEQFVKTLNANQRVAFTQFVTEPTLARLQPLLRELEAQQRTDLLELLATASSSHQTAGSRESTGAAGSSTESSRTYRRAPAQPPERQRDTHEDHPTPLPKPPDARRPELPPREGER